MISGLIGRINDFAIFVSCEEVTLLLHKGIPTSVEKQRAMINVQLINWENFYNILSSKGNSKCGGERDKGGGNTAADLCGRYISWK